MLVGAASAKCVLKGRMYGDWYCDPGNWCLGYDGQQERLVENYWDCDGDGAIDHMSWDIQEGQCCNVVIR
jgi:hypothetical protein